ncbi:MAG TPA: hypothetical protein PLO62_12375 [Candidatus Hydrogenedentes bacterium]|nr:hypothetical protein [Candidatus Hydrogenedentota bacterium]HOS02800.1 hypothetical protein [Candidatus Hydrogenedentota bacterium]
MRTILFGAEASELAPLIERTPELTLVTDDPEIVVCYGGDGTLLSAEAKWPGVPKVPIRNSRLGNRCIPHPADQVIDRLVQRHLSRTAFIKLEGLLRRAGGEYRPFAVAMNEFNVHMGRINSAVRFLLTFDNEPYLGGHEIVGDGFVVCTPFGSTAYFNKITRGIFHTGLGIAFKSTPDQTDHLVVDDSATVAVRITRGPAVLAYDNAGEYVTLEEDDELIIRRHAQPAILLTWGTVRHPSDAF